MHLASGDRHIRVCGIVKQSPNNFFSTRTFFSAAADTECVVPVNNLDTEICLDLLKIGVLLPTQP